MSRTTFQQHAVISKKVFSRDHDYDGSHLLCCWDDCELPGYEMHKCIQKTSRNPDGSVAQQLSYVFCSERHRQYFLNSHRKYGFTA